MQLTSALIPELALLDPCTASTQGFVALPTLYGYNSAAEICNASAPVLHTSERCSWQKHEAQKTCQIALRRCSAEGGAGNGGLTMECTRERWSWQMREAQKVP